MTTLEVEGAKILMPDRCVDCDVKPAPSDAIAYAKKWNELAKTCSFCGTRIKLVGGSFLHLHTKREGNIWTIEDPEWEPSFECYRIGTFGSVDIYAHQSCAQKGMPYCDWGTLVEHKGIPKGVELPAFTLLSPCDDCGVEITQQDIEEVVGRMYGLSHGSLCVYCGKTIQLKTISIWHRSLSGKHIGRWHFNTWTWEPFFDWTIYRPIGNMLNVRGHIACGSKAMPFARWTPPERVLR